jgi:tRNA (cmo5U34)-methyltransferase
MSEFDARAAEWDKNPMHWDRSAAIVEEIIKRLPIDKSMIAMEYGAGTGIASFLMKDHLKTITMIDNSSEMVRVTNEKIKTSKSENLSVLKFDLEHSDYTTGTFDLIFTQMVLHHVSDIKGILKRFAMIVNKGGFIAIADLYTEDGSFHGDKFDGHKGFEPEDLAKILERLNFSDIVHKPCFTMKHKLSETETRDYDLFLLTARKK